MWGPSARFVRRSTGTPAVVATSTAMLREGGKRSASRDRLLRASASPDWLTGFSLSRICCSRSSSSGFAILVSFRLPGGYSTRKPVFHLRPGFGGADGPAAAQAPLSIAGIVAHGAEQPPLALDHPLAAGPLVAQ